MQKDRVRERILELLDNKPFISGETLARNLGVSRTAVWRHIKILRSMGYNIVSIKNKGYHLVSRPDIPYPEEITPYLNTKIIGKKLYHFKKIPTTNLFARELIKKNTEEGTVIVADIQSKGRGRKNREWFSPDGGLWFSIILYPNIPPYMGMHLTMSASVAVAESIEEIANINVEIKWPNDLLIRRKKVCGILTEIDAGMDRINYAIVGIGINVNNRLRKDLEGKATTLKKEVGSEISRVNLLRSILKKFDGLYLDLIHNKYEYIKNGWISHSKIAGREIMVKENSSILKGTAEGIDERGYLVLKTKKGKIKILSGDVEYIN